MTDPHERLAKEHRELAELADAVWTARADPKRLATLFFAFRERVRAHFHKEDSCYYVAIDRSGKMKDRELMHTLRNDHAAVVFALESFAIKMRKGVPPEEWSERWQRTVEVLRSHCLREEEKLFAHLSQWLKPEEIQRLSADLAKLT